jgi:hypothetical protein
MKSIALVSMVAVAGVLAMGDTVNSGTSAFTNMPANLATGLNSGVPYWDNASGDGSQPDTTGNVGYFLTNAGLFAGGVCGSCNPTGYLAAASGNPDAPSSFNLVRNTNSLVITLIGQTTGAANLSFGWYDTSSPATLHQLYGDVNGVPTLGSQVGSPVNLTGTVSTNYGFYLTQTVSGTAYTWYSNTALNSVPNGTDSAGHQHFSLFRTADTNLYYLGVEDWFSAGNTGTEKYGDFNDLIVKINSDPVAAPEPATFALMGAGLLGLGIIRQRRRKA